MIHTRMRLRREIIGTVCMRNIHHIRCGEYFIDETLDGFLGIWNYNYTYKMDFANAKVLMNARKITTKNCIDQLQ